MMYISVQQDPEAYYCINCKEAHYPFAGPGQSLLRPRQWKNDDTDSEGTDQEPPPPENRTRSDQAKVRTAVVLTPADDSKGKKERRDARAPMQRRKEGKGEAARHIGDVHRQGQLDEDSEGDQTGGAAGTGNSVHVAATGGNVTEIVWGKMEREG